MLLEGNAQFLCTLDQLVPRHLPGEALVLHLLDDGVRIHLIEAAVRADVRDGDDEATQLVAGVDGPRQEAYTRHAGVVAVAQDRLDDLGRIAETLRLFGAAGGLRLRGA